MLDYSIEVIFIAENISRLGGCHAVDAILHLGYTLSKLQTAKKQMWVCYNHCMKQYSSTVQVGLALKMVHI